MPEATVTDYRAKKTETLFHSWDNESLVRRARLIQQVDSGEYPEGADPKSKYHHMLFPYGRDPQTHAEDNLLLLKIELRRRGLSDS